VKYVLSLILFVSGFISVAQTEDSLPPKIFINCQQARCYTDYLKVELGYFDIVRDQAEADVQILVTDQRNASGGRNYQLNFLGQNDYDGKVRLIEFFTNNDDTENVARKKLLKGINAGLLSYLIDTDLLNDADIKFPLRKAAVNKAVNEADPWNNWVFGLGADGRFEGESNRKSIRTGADVRGGRTTEESKLSFNSYYNQRVRSVTIDSVESKVRINSYGFNTLYVKSFATKWSAGGFVKGYHSVFQNIKFSSNIAPAIEYSVFPVEEFNERQLRWIYQAGVQNLNYIETTIFDELEETLPYHQITGIMGLTQPWGNFSAEVSGFQYLSDLKKYRVRLEIELSLRVAEGLFFRVYGNGSQIKNQISLARTSSDTSSILLGGSQLPTTIDYYTSFGFNYTFGSMNNSIVNPRFSGVN
jgi:hypothetical protein